MKQPVAAAPEHWRRDVGADSVAVLDVPGLLERSRVFEVDVTLVVDAPTALQGAWHELSLELDGRRQWCRRVDTRNPGQTDGLDYHQQVRLAPDQGLRIRAVAQVKGCRIRQLLVEAREER
ncbi:hypothetical protein [uncultured Hydrogenophaga sp.]|uniref:hypothetical protein n=1 Tax=uncultured Hydrogenophaga sp. TaxID=199683 RepID=UPI00265F2979|nr:hypothetical protein [uncultured Hydrogenophaga sp.]